MENDRRPSWLVPKLTRSLFLFTFLVIKFISQEEASCCCVWLLGGGKGAAPASPTADMKEFAPIWLCASCCVLSGIVSEAGAAPRLCNMNKRIHAKSQTQQRPGKGSGREKPFLLFYCLPVFLPFTPSSFLSVSAQQ